MPHAAQFCVKKQLKMLMYGRERRSPHFSLSCTRLRRFHRTAGDGMTFSMHRRSRFCIAVLALLVGGVGSGQSLYKYRGADGEWIYSDRPPDDGDAAEVRDLPQGMDEPQVRVLHDLVDRQVRIRAENEFHAPVEVILALDELRNVGRPPADQSMRWVLPPRSASELLRLDAVAAHLEPSVRLRYVWLPGDPTSQHAPARAYRAPFAVARKFRISQAFPSAMTHTTPDSRYAVDFAMPIGTDVYAARGGTVVEVARTNYRGGFDTSRDGAAANIVRILHADGTFAVYAHLNRSSIRVQPGEVIERGQYIAESGDTGFSSGPHLHFVVVLNRGLRLESVPVVFEAANSNIITPETEFLLTAY